MRKFTVKLPLSVEIGVKKKKKYYLNLNIYRNKVGYLMNNVKKEYHRIAEPLIPRYKTGFKQMELTYTLYLPNKLKRDVSNVCSVVDKFFCDSLVKCGVIEDDNYTFLKKIHYEYGGQDEKGKGYVIVTVKEVKDGTPTM